MDLSNLEFFDAAHKEMRYINQRQTVLAENIANSDTPGYRPKTLAEPNFKSALAKSTGNESGLQPVSTDPNHGAGGTPTPNAQPAATDPAHLGNAPTSPDFQEKLQDSFEVTPNGNGVALEQQMKNLADNRLAHEKITKLYRKQLGFIKTALGKGR